ncbi:guanine nucleotide exchange protein for ADP-robosylation factor [Scheffersomyces amazonensis]|uniref:guanine nucleotide exchange protein for ADP-robosylation factor n=1 Tax=Scheffersomyces amazonensis TaxID=1078765 RepID=UPI00315C8D2C
MPEPDTEPNHQPNAEIEPENEFESVELGEEVEVEANTAEAGDAEVGEQEPEQEEEQEPEQVSEPEPKPEPEHDDGSEVNGHESEVNGHESEVNGHESNGNGSTSVVDQNQQEHAQNGESSTPMIDVTASSIDASVQSIDSRTIESPRVVSGSTPSRRHSTVSFTSNTNSNATVDNSQIFKKTFEIILESKEAKKIPELKEAIQNALNSFNEGASRDPYIILTALQVTCEKSNSNDLKAKAIDLFAKLFDYAQFDDENDKVQLTERSVYIISGCFDGEGTDPDVELQVVRALMHSILLMPCHGAPLLKAVRQIYNVFIFSLSARNQSVAQGTLTQVIQAIFRRISDSTSFKARANKSNSNTRLSLKSSKEELNIDQQQPPFEEKLTLKNLEKFNDEHEDNVRVDAANQANEKDEDLFVKDAFLIFRAMCKISIKPIDETADMRSHSVRSKLLSLHIIHTILKEHIDIFLSSDVVIFSSKEGEQTRLINAVKQHICLALSRNAASSLAPVFELSLEIFWIIVSNLRAEFKREIPVFLDEIYFPVGEMKSSTPHQKRYLLSVIERLCNDSRCIIEFYLNYDCDASMPNICEKIIEYLTRLSLQRVEVSPSQKLAYRENKRNDISVYDVTKIANLTSSTMSSKAPEPEIYNQFPLEYALKMTSINCTVAFLRSLHSWAHKGINNSFNFNGSKLELQRHRSGTLDSNSSTLNNSRNASFVNNSVSTTNNTTNTNINNSESNDNDIPEQFESSKQRKKALLEGIKQFNQKAKKGISYFISKGFIEVDDPVHIAQFLLETDGLDKTVIGEYLGEGDEKNIAIMHAFVDDMDFTNTDFVDAMRRFLQAFRLPGEAQKIDRFMLKFAERYLLGNPNIFSNADAAYVLAYSVILLNTDLHSPQIKNRMTFDNFVANNAGIDDGKDLPRDFLQGVYEEIKSNEIKLKSEQHAALLAGDLAVVPTSSGGGGLFGNRDWNREVYIHASKEMSSKTEKLVIGLGKKLNSSTSNGFFYTASHVDHVKSIFDTLWMSILAALTPPFKEYDEDDVTQICLEGIKLSIRIASLFNLDYARGSFIGALIQFANLSTYEEMKAKNVNAIYILLDVAVTDGNQLGNAWGQVLTSISQVERLKLIAQGIDQESIPDVSVAKLVNRSSVEGNSRPSTSIFRSFTSSSPSASQAASIKFHNQQLSPFVAQLFTKKELDVAVDKVFANSANLSGEAIVDFVKALSKLALEEIQSSGQSDNPRTFALQKVVDICGYNMNRIRLEWSQLWSILGETFNEVGCHSSIQISFFAIDSLRQMSMTFLEIEELSHFKFQKEFLKPFGYIIVHNGSLEVKGFVLECINHMILAKASKIKSGWKTIFEVLTAAAKENKESLVMTAYKLANWIHKDYIAEVRAQDSFKELVICFTTLAKNERFQRVSLLSLDVLSRLINHIAQYSFTESDSTTSTTNGVGNGADKSELLDKLWFPLLEGFVDIIMQGDELEVRARALNYLFTVISQYGEYFEIPFWDRICKELLFPIFGILSKHWQLNIDESNDKLSVWLSTTLIQALNQMISLFGQYFDSLNHLLPMYLDLITSCICQENDTIAKIGRECLSTLLIDSCNKFETGHWKQISQSFDNLFDLTTATELFTLDPLRNRSKHDNLENGDVVSQGEEFDGTETSFDNSTSNNTLGKSKIVVKSVLQLLLIQTLSELFESDSFYEAIPYDALMELAFLLLKSYQFAKKFNDHYDLRVRLWNAGVIERLPNLLKQESSSSAVFINVMFRMYCDDDKTNSQAKKTIIEAIVPLCNSITERYSAFDETNHSRNIATWKPVIVEIYQGYVELDDEDFIQYTPIMYTLTLRLFSRSMSTDLRAAIRAFLARVGEQFIKGTST